MNETTRHLLTFLWAVQCLVASAFAFRIVTVIWMNHLRKRFRLVMWAALLGFVGLALETGYRFVFRAYADYIGTPVTTNLDTLGFTTVTLIHTAGLIALGAAIEMLVRGEYADRENDEEAHYGRK